MKRIPLNIERSAFRDGSYVGYGGGLVWLIVRNSAGWTAYPPKNRPDVTLVFAPTLMGIGARLGEMK